jgi:hypothetical protein
MSGSFVYENAEKGARKRMPWTSLKKTPGTNSAQRRSSIRAFRQACLRAEEWLGIRESSERVGDRRQEITHLRRPEDLWGLDEDDPLHEDTNEIG